MTTIDIEEDRACGGNHPNQSCIHADFHMIFSRKLSIEEWSEFSERVDDCWSESDNYWHPECIAGLVSELFSDVTVVQVEFRNDGGLGDDRQMDL